MKILIIEDEIELALDIVNYLRYEDYLCEVAHTFSEAEWKLDSYEYDCVLLDIMLPGGSGLKLLSKLKKENREEGVIIISAKDALNEKIEGLRSGADDYLVKPFHMGELLARIESVTRRNQFDRQPIIQFNEIKIDLKLKRVSIKDRELQLTKKEYELLLYFIGNKHRILSKSSLAEHLSGDFADMFDSHDFIYAHVKNLKRKLKEYDCEIYIKTMYGVGYKWEE